MPRVKTGQYVINPFSGRSIKVGSRLHKQLVEAGVFEPQKPLIKKTSQNNHNDDDNFSDEDSSVDIETLSKEEKEAILKMASKLSKK